MAESKSSSCLSDLLFFGCFGVVIIVACGGGGLLFLGMNSQEPEAPVDPMIIESRSIDETELPR